MRNTAEKWQSCVEDCGGGLHCQVWEADPGGICVPLGCSSTRCGPTSCGRGRKGVLGLPGVSEDVGSPAGGELGMESLTVKPSISPGGNQHPPFLLLNEEDFLLRVSTLL